MLSFFRKGEVEKQMKDLSEKERRKLLDMQVRLSLLWTGIHWLFHSTELICDAWLENTVICRQGWTFPWQYVLGLQATSFSSSQWVSQLTLIQQVPDGFAMFNFFTLHTRWVLSLIGTATKIKIEFCQKTKEKLFQEASCLREWTLYDMGWV